jgi:hypothetical protein
MASSKEGTIDTKSVVLKFFTAYEDEAATDGGFTSVEKLEKREEDGRTCTNISLAIILKLSNKPGKTQMVPSQTSFVIRIEIYSAG